MNWEARFRWLLDHCTDGFATPDGWMSARWDDPISDEDFRFIVETIDRHMANQISISPCAPSS
jgi:hypothetical protein